MKLNVEGSGHFDGIYELEEGYHNKRECLINTHWSFQRFPLILIY